MSKTAISVNTLAQIHSNGCHITYSYFYWMKLNGNLLPCFMTLFYFRCEPKNIQHSEKLAREFVLKLCVTEAHQKSLQTRTEYNSN